MLKICIVFIFHISSLFFSTESIADLGRDKEKQFAQVRYLDESRSIQVGFNVNEKDLNDFLVPYKTLGRGAIPFKTLLVKAMPSEIEISYEFKEAIFKKSLPDVQTKQIFRCHESKVRESSLDEEFHKQGQTPLYTIDFLGDFRGVPISKVTLYPVSYNLTQYHTTIFTDIIFHLRSIYQDEIKLPQTWFNQQLNNQYLIIAPDAFIPAFKDYVEYKTNQGYKVMLIPIEIMGATFNQIKINLKKIYDNPQTRFSYAMLVGHENLFPTEYVKTSSSDLTPTDHNYFTFGSDDMIADVLYSRLTVKNGDEVKRQLQRFMDYENNLDTYENILGIASSEGNDPSDSDIIDTILDQFDEQYGPIKRYQSNIDSTVPTIIDDFSNKLKLVYYLGHGTGSAWSSLYDDQQFSILDIKKMSNEQQRPVLFDISCSNGRYAINKFGERMMNTINRNGKSVGAASYLGGTVSISWQAPAVFAQGMSMAFTENNTLGETILAGKIHLLNTLADMEEIKDTFKWFALQGDPTLSMKGAR